MDRSLAFTCLLCCLLRLPAHLHQPWTEQTVEEDEAIRCQPVQPTGPVHTGHFFLLCLLSPRLPRKDRSEPITFSTLVPQLTCLV